MPRLNPTNLNIERFSGVYSKEELITYFNCLNEVFSDKEPKLLHEINILLTTNDDYTVPISYDPKTKNWHIDDKTILSNEDIGRTIVDEITEQIDNNSIIIGSTINVCRHETHHVKAHLSHLKSNDEWIQIHEITTEKANFKDDNNQTWLETAIKMGQTKIAEDIMDKMSYFNKHPVLTSLHGLMVTIIAGSAIASFATAAAPLGILLSIATLAELNVMKLELNRADKKRLTEATDNQETFSKQIDVSKMAAIYKKIAEKKPVKQPVQVDDAFKIKVELTMDKVDKQPEVETAPLKKLSIK